MKNVNWVSVLRLRMYIACVQVKPLGVIWGKYPQWGPHNTIMFDDLRRNFIMNPQSGLKVLHYIVISYGNVIC